MRKMNTIARLDKAKHRTLMTNILVDIYRDFELSTSLIFKGGTACYFIYHLDRFSTDLDFDCISGVDEEKILQKINTILAKYGEVKASHNKRNTLFSLLSYGDIDHNIKVEISKRGIRGKYARVNWHSFSVLVMTESSIFANKLVALLDRLMLANRDIYDIHFFLKNGIDIDIALLEEITGKSLKEYLLKTISFLKSLPQGYKILE